MHWMHALHQKSSGCCRETNNNRMEVVTRMEMTWTWEEEEEGEEQEEDVEEDEGEVEEEEEVVDEQEEEVEAEEEEVDEVEEVVVEEEAAVTRRRSSDRGICGTIPRIASTWNIWPSKSNKTIAVNSLPKSY